MGAGGNRDELEWTVPEGHDADATIRRVSPTAETVPASNAPVALEDLPLLTLGARAAVSGPQSELTAGEVLGEGGMGRVLVGRQRSMLREVALKTLKSGSGPGLAAALVSEGIISGQLEHPNIIPVHQLGRTSDGAPLLVMKRVHGTSWTALLRDSTHPAWDRLHALSSDRLTAHLEILMQVCQALDFAHGKGVVHLDVKPDNVMVGESGDVYLVDWGVAAHFEAPGQRTLVGTPSFLAPELLDHALPLGPRTDVFLLGGCLHQVLTGAPPYQGDDLQAVLRQAHACPAPRLPASAPEELAALCRQATARDPAQRPAGALAFRQALKDFLSHAGSLEVTQTAERRLAALKVLVQAEHPDRGEFARGATEARFGFALAVQQWPGNARARAGQVATLELVLQHELREGNAHAARSALEELAALPDGPAVSGWRAQVEALVHRQAQDRASAEALRQRERDLDRGVSRRQRFVFLGVMLAPAVIAALFFGQVGTAALQANGLTHAAGPREMFFVTLGLLVLGVVSVAVGRKALLRNAANRNFIAGFLGTLAVWALNRLLGWIEGDSIAHVVRGDLLAAGTAALLGGLLIERSWLLASLAAFAGAVFNTVAPERALVTLPATSLVVVLILILGDRSRGAG
ncbi:MAG: serine/threonine protein kinase [Myxococcaceae bacterium]|nr:serine/threonine protein kinase [Myxococcaceae bacterium]